MNRKIIGSATVAVLGLIALVYGVALVSIPAAFITLGVLLIAFALLPDWGV
jgi:hypothetical protein